MLRLGPTDAAASISRAREVLAGRFTFLGETAELGTPDWRRRHGSHLWSFHLQYQEYLTDLAWAAMATAGNELLARVEELVESWMESAGRGGGDAWEPYVLARRSANWIRTLLLIGGRMRPEVQSRMTGSLHAQLRRLDQRIEYHLLGNHLLADLHALALGGLFFGGQRALKWRRERMPQYWEALLDQVLPDGMHEERSPMYHAIVLADAIELATLAQAAGFAASPEVRDVLAKMTRVLRLLCRPDGTLHLFNDCVNGETPPPAAILGRAARLVPPAADEPHGAWALPDAGYWGVTRPDGSRLIVDCGIPGPPWQPGHAHCDLLSFELDLRGHPLFVDSGVAGYGGHPLREYARSTRAHNTLSVDGLEQSEVWSTFRMGRPAEPVDPSASGDERAWRFEGGCRPFHDRASLHRRRLELRGDGLEVADTVSGASGRTITSWLHLHPAWRAFSEGGGWRVDGPGGRITVRFRGVDRVELVAGERGPRPQGWHCPEFGKALVSQVFELTCTGYDGRELAVSVDWTA